MFKDENRHYSLRKLSVGLASVLIGISFVSGNSHTVKADTIKDGSNGAQTVVQTTKGSNAAIKIDTKDDASAASKANSEFTPKEQSQTSGVVKKNSDAITQDIRQKAVNASEATIKVQNNTVKDNSNETTLNAKGSKAATESMPKEGKTEVKENQDWTDSAKNKLQMSTVRSTTSKRLNAKMLAVSKAVSQANDTNGGFDESTWGKLDVYNWYGHVQDGVYQLTDYTGDPSHIIVPNEADFEQAGKSTNGLQVGITCDTIQSLLSRTNQTQTIAFSKTNDQKVKAIGTDWSNAFSYNSTLSKFDGSNLDISSITNMSGMFGNTQISDLTPLAHWDVSNVTNMHYMFSNNQISDLTPLAHWDTSNVTRMDGMFYNNKIIDLTPLAHWDTSKVTDMSWMFCNNPDLIDLRPIADWNISSVPNDSSLFYSDTQLNLTNINNTPLMQGFLKTPNALQGATFITNNADLVKATINQDLPNLTNTAKRTITFNIPNATPKTIVQTINYKAVAPVQIDLDNQQIVQTYPVKESDWQLDTSKQNDDVIIDGVICFKPVKIPHVNGYKAYTVPEIKGLLEPDQTVISRQQADINKPINVTVTYKLVDSNTNDAFALDSKNGLHEHANVNDNGGYDADFWGKINVDDWDYTVNGDRIEIIGLKYGVSTGANDAVIVPNLDDFKLAGKDGGAKSVYISKKALGEINVVGNATAHKYYGLSKTNGSKFVTDSDLNNAFTNSNLTHADLNSLDTGNVTDMSQMFMNTSGLNSLDVSNWKTSNVTNMESMFDGANRLTSLDVSKWKTGNVTNMNGMFNGTSGLTSLDVSNWDTSKVTDMNGMFSGASSLTSLDVSNWNTGNVTDMSAMFGYASSLMSLDVSNWKTSNVTNMASMFSGASDLTGLDVLKWDTSKVTNMSYMFNGASSLTSLDVSKWDTSKVTYMSRMFEDASGLTSLDVSKWETGNVTDMNLMFSGASNLTSLDVSKWDTSKVTDMSDMFNSASSLTTLGVSKWNTGNVTDMSRMFAGASSLTSLDVSKWDTSKVTYMSGMFAVASSLTNLDVSKWDTSKVTDMGDMFNGASSLTNLDVSKWDTSKVTDIDMSWMFNGASSLALIVNGDKFADYLVKNNFADSNINSDVKSVTTDNTKLLQLLTNDVQHNSATRTIVFTFPIDYSPDLTKYHLTKTGNTYQIKQSADYDTSYVQGTVLINATDDITKHHIDTTKPYKLSDTWQPNYDKLVLAHKNADGTVSFDKVQLPKVPGYKTKVTRNNGLLLVSYLVFAPEKPATNNNLNELQFSNKLATNNPVQFNSTVESNIVVKSDMYQVVNDDHNWQLPVIKSYNLKFATNKNQIIFAYTKDKQYNYRFVLTFKDGQYRLATFNKENKLLKTYSIKSYKKLAKIIHSLVSMNIA